MGIEIVKIDNSFLRTAAQDSDINNDGIIAGREELNLFEETAKKGIKNDLCKKSDYKKAMKSFEVSYPTENEYLYGLAVESDKNKSGTLNNKKEIKKYIRKAKDAEKAGFTTKEEIEATTEGYYQKKSTWQKIRRGLLIAGGVILAGCLGYLLGGKVKNNYYSRKIKEFKRYIALHPNKTKNHYCKKKTTTNGPILTKRDIEFTKLAHEEANTYQSAITAATATIGGITTAIITNKNR